MILPPDSVRGRIRAFIAQHADLLGDDVLECGARVDPASAAWMTARDLATGRWTATDIQGGRNVDVVADLHCLPSEWRRRFSGILCSEVLEHLRRPNVALAEMRRVIKPSGVLVVTTLTAFPVHGYPNDYRRWTEAGLAAELEDAGFEAIKTASAGAVVFALNDHGEAGVTRLTCPIHVFAVARAPSLC